MMKYFQKQFSYAQIAFAILSLIAGVLMHFLYEWTEYNYLAGLISPVNESTWEHLKLLFFPVLIFTIFEYFYIGRLFPAFITARTIGCTVGLLFILYVHWHYWRTLSLDGYPHVFSWGNPVLQPDLVSDSKEKSRKSLHKYFLHLFPALSYRDIFLFHIHSANASSV